MNPCGRQGPCRCAVCNLTRAAQLDTLAAHECRVIGDVPRAERYEADGARIRRALHRLRHPPWAYATPGLRAASSRP